MSARLASSLTGWTAVVPPARRVRANPAVATVSSVEPDEDAGGDCRVGPGERAGGDRSDLGRCEPDGEHSATQRERGDKPRCEPGHRRQRDAACDQRGGQSRCRSPYSTEGTRRDGEGGGEDQGGERDVDGAVVDEEAGRLRHRLAQHRRADDEDQLDVRVRRMGRHLADGEGESRDDDGGERVVASGDRELVIGLGVEVVVGQCGRDGRNRGGAAPPGGADDDHGCDDQQGDVGVRGGPSHADEGSRRGHGEPGAERHPGGRTQALAVATHGAEELRGYKCRGGRHRVQDMRRGGTVGCPRRRASASVAPRAAAISGGGEVVVARRIRGLEPEEWSQEVRAALQPTLGPVAALEGRAPQAAARFGGRGR